MAEFPYFQMKEKIHKLLRGGINAKYKVVTIKLWFSEQDFDLNKITPEYVKKVLEQKGILTATDYEIEVTDI